MGARHVVVSASAVNLQGNRILLSGATPDALKNLPLFIYRY